MTAAALLVLAAAVLLHGVATRGPDTTDALAGIMLGAATVCAAIATAAAIVHFATPQA